MLKNAAHRSFTIRPTLTAGDAEATQRREATWCRKGFPEGLVPGRISAFSPVVSEERPAEIVTIITRVSHSGRGVSTSRGQAAVGPASVDQSPPTVCISTVPPSSATAGIIRADDDGGISVVRVCESGTA